MMSRMVEPAIRGTRAVEAASGLYVAGGWRGGAAHLPVTDPATGAPVGEVVAATPEQVREAAAAHAAFPAWSALPPDERAAPLRRAHALVLERAPELARA